MALALPKARGSAFHWMPVRKTYTMAAKIRRDSIGLRPPPARRRYTRPSTRSRRGINGSTLAQNASETSHDLICPILGTKVCLPAGKNQDLFTDKILIPTGKSMFDCPEQNQTSPTITLETEQEPSPSTVKS
jgi:hypothetical protein